MPHHLLPRRVPSFYDLPGPHVSTKRLALEYGHHDTRMMACLIEAAKAQWPEAYQCDLYEHDRRWLKENPGVACILILRPHGTRLYPVVGFNKHDAEYIRKAIRYDSGVGPLNCIDDLERRPKFFHITAGGESIEIGWHGAIKLVTFAEPAVV